MNSGSGFVIALLVCCLGVSLLAVGTATAADGFAQEDIDADDVLLAIDIEADGDAVWTIEYRNRLETEDDENAFEQLRTDIENDPEPYVDQFDDRMGSTAANAANATGREMSISEISIEAERRDLPQEYGVVSYTFRWSNFAAVDGERLRVGDAIDGLFLDEETTLLISWSADNELHSASPSPSETRDNSLVYTGPTNFASGEPRIELGPPGVAPDDGGIAVSTAIVGALVVLAIVAATGFAAYRRRDDSPKTPTTDDRSGADGAPSSDGAPKRDSDRTRDEGIDPALLSNEEQVLRLIESEGGRMKQQAVVERLEWTDAKTSQVTKQLREEGKLEGFRLGRENVLSLPEDGENSE